MFLCLFYKWNSKKRVAHKSKKIPYFHAVEIWWTQLGKNISSESLGKGEDFLRPTIIIQNFFGKSALIMPLTSKSKEGRYYLSFEDKNGFIQAAILPQVRYVDGRRLKHKLSEVPAKTFLLIRNSFFELIQNNPR